MTRNRFFSCSDCGSVIVSDPERLYESAKDCPACLSPGEPGVADPFAIVDVTDL